MTLRFSDDEMKDVLKSLMLQDEGGHRHDLISLPRPVLVCL